LISEKGWSRTEAYHLVYFIYAALGTIKLLLSLLLSQQCEVVNEPPPAQSAETAPLLGNQPTDGIPSTKKERKIFSLLPSISKESQGTLARLCMLFALDSFASGLAPK